MEPQTGSVRTELPPPTLQELLRAQRNEITEYHVYSRLAVVTRDAANRDVLARIARDEEGHYRFFKQYTGQEVAPNTWKVRWYVLLARVLGLTFAIKRMEQGEEQAQAAYGRLSAEIPAARSIIDDEAHHEQELIGMISEERLRYVGSVVLGLNDALVELTGALAGLTLALQNTRLIAMTGMITGIAASLSMAASEYLSTKTEHGETNPRRAALYTGITYVFTVTALILPYLILSNYIVALIATLSVAVLIILFFSYYVSVVQGISFRRRFVEMAGIGLGVAAVSFGIGYVVRQVFGVQV